MPTYYVPTGPTHGRGTFHLEDEGRKKYVIDYNLSVPLLEGGLMFQGQIYSSDQNKLSDIIIHVSYDTLNSIHTFREGKNHFKFMFHNTEPKEMWGMSIQPSPYNKTEFSGVVTSPKEKQISFTYKDFGELITGTILVIFVGVAAALCALSLVIGYLRTKNCRNIKVSFGKKFNLKNLQFKFECNVECLDNE